MAGVFGLIGCQSPSPGLALLIVFNNNVFGHIGCISLSLSLALPTTFNENNVVTHTVTTVRVVTRTVTTVRVVTYTVTTVYVVTHTVTVFLPSVSDYFWVNLTKAANGSWIWSTGYVQPQPGLYWLSSYPGPSHDVGIVGTAANFVLRSNYRDPVYGGAVCRLCQGPYT